LSEVVEHFYPEGELPTNKAECISKVRPLEDICDDPWFHEEAGMTSIVALIKKIDVGDHVLVTQGEGDHDMARALGQHRPERCRS
jgi:biotin synthase-related radical SAM superfamily protein